MNHLLHRPGYAGIAFPVAAYAVTVLGRHADEPVTQEDLWYRGLVAVAVFIATA